MEYIDVVDENNLLTGIVKERSIVDKENLWHRIVSIWIMNKNGEILLQKRVSTKLRNPNMWGKTGGHVSSGETPIEAIIREVKEELGITLDKKIIEELDVYKSTNQNNKYFGHNFFAIVDYKIEEFKLQLEEVADIKYVTIEELENLKKDSNYVFNKWDDESFFEQIKMLKEKRTKLCT